MNTKKICLTLLAATVFKEKLSDLLLTNAAAAAAGFTIRDVSAYGAAAIYRTAMEQVHGRVHAIEIIMLLEPTAARSVLDDIRAALPGRGVEYRIGALTDMGEI